MLTTPHDPQTTRAIIGRALTPPLTFTTAMRILNNAAGHTVCRRMAAHDPAYNADWCYYHGQLRTRAEIITLAQKEAQP